MRKTIRNTITGIIGGILLYTGVATGQVANSKVSNVADSTKNIADTTKNKRAYELPQANSTYVGSAIIGVSPVVTIAANQEYNFYMNTFQGFPKENFPLKVKAYESFDAFVKDVDARIKYYEKHTEIVSKSRLERDKVAFEQIKKYQGYRVKAEDVVIKKMAEESLADLVMQPYETYRLSKEVKDMDKDGKENVLLPVKIFHDGGEYKGKHLDGESIPFMLNLTPLVEIEGQVQYRTAPVDTSKTKKPCPDCPKCPPATKPDTTNTATTKKDSIPPVKEEKSRFIIGGGAELNSYFNDNGFIPQCTAGIKFGPVSISGLFGYNNIDQNTEKYFPASYIDATGRKIEFGGSTVRKNIKNNIMQPGLELMLFPNKNVGLGVGVQYNMIKSDTTGTIYQTVTNDVGKTRAILIPLDEKTGKLEFLTINPTVELKFNHVSIYGGGKFALKAPYKNSASVFAGLKVNFGK